MSGGVAVERTPPPEPRRPLLVTHSGTFHLDDAFAYAVLRLAIGFRGPADDHVPVRTRDEAAITAADVAWDAGAVHDGAAGRLDHHQRSAPVRERDGLPYSAAGLISRHHGGAAVRALLDLSSAEEFAAVAASAIGREVVRRIDEIDNGDRRPRRRARAGVAGGWLESSLGLARCR